MSQTFVAKLGEQVSEAYFSQPAFDLFKDLPELFAALFKRLQGYGLALNGIKFQTPDAHLGEAQLRCDLPGAVVRIFLDRFDISSTLGQSSVEHTHRALSVVEALQVHSPGVVFGSYASVLKLHGVLA